MITKSKIPQVRFRGFIEEWGKNKLGNKVEFFSGLTYSPNDVIKQNGTLVLRSSNVKNGMIVNADNVYVNPEVVNCDNVQKGDIVVVVRNGSRALIGKHAQIQNEMKNTVIGAFMTGVRSEQPSFLNALLDSSKFNKEIEKNLGATINQITTGAFKKMIFSFPKEAEQTKIGNYFQKLDKLIEQKEKKYHKLKQFKKAMLDKMFPKNGADTPEVRFKGFRGNWEEKRLDNIADIIGGGTPSTNITEYWNGDIDWYSPTEIGYSNFVNGSQKKITQLGLEKSSAKIHPANKTILFTSRAGIGDMAILNKEGSTNQGFQSLILKDDYIPYFIYSAGHLIKKYALTHASGSTFLEISGKQLGNMNIKVPSTEEQQKIGNYFQKLDKQIDLQLQEIEKLKNIKKASLDKMFV